MSSKYDVQAFTRDEVDSSRLFSSTVVRNQQITEYSLCRPRRLVDIRGTEPISVQSSYTTDYLANPTAPREKYDGKLRTLDR
jgi:hypothetical protein